jgi:hypothetical protein
LKGSDSDAETSKLRSKKGFVKSARVGKKIQILIQKREHFENNLKILKFFKSVIKEEILDLGGTVWERLTLLQ